MLFNSYVFIFAFFPLAFLGMFLLGKVSRKLAALWLCVASLVFYASWDARYVLLLSASIAVNFGAGCWIGSVRARGRLTAARNILIAAVTANIALLGYYKYTDFFLSSANQLLGTQFTLLNVILPLGISFFTFTQIAFLVDVYRGLAREYNVIHYILFVTYFPHLIAGPVLHHQQMMPQFARPETYQLNPQRVGAGLTIFIFGLCKKVLIADELAGYARAVFDAADAGTPLMVFEAWGGALIYTLQLYFDFSAYCDMAIGLSLMLNVRMPLNFNSPYKATSIIDFWRRWHMTLSAFLRDYLYIPLGGNRKGPIRRHANLFITMLIGGFWHGAGWTFVLWGALHGVYLIINHLWEKLSAGWRLPLPSRLVTLLAGGLTFTAVVVGWALFRATSLSSAGIMLGGMFGLHGISLPAPLEQPLAPLVSLFPGYFVFEGFQPVTERASTTVLYVVLGLAAVWLLPNVQQMFAAFRPIWESEGKPSPLAPLTPLERTLGFAWRLTPLRAVLAGLFFFICLCRMASQPISEFLYFQF